jgi:hypothetical protein
LDGKYVLYLVASRGETTIYRQPWRDGRLTGAAQPAIKLPFALRQNLWRQRLRFLERPFRGGLQPPRWPCRSLSPQVKCGWEKCLLWTLLSSDLNSRRKADDRLPLGDSFRVLRSPPTRRACLLSPDFLRTADRGQDAHPESNQFPRIACYRVDGSSYPRLSFVT